MHRRTSRIASLVVGVVLASTLVVIAAPAAQAADPTPITGGRITWGVKSSFRTYLLGAGAAGSITPSAEATQEAGNGRLRFPVNSGYSDVPGGSVTAKSVGAVRMMGHGGILDVSITDVRVTITGTTGTVVVDATSRPYTGPSQTTPADPVTYDDVTFATLDLSAVTPATTSTGSTWTDIPAKLTAAGVPILAGFYPAGTDLDPVTLTTMLNQVPTCTIGTPKISTITSGSPAQSMEMGLTLSPGTCTPAGATGAIITIRVVGEASPRTQQRVGLDETSFSWGNLPPVKGIVVNAVAVNDANYSPNQKTIDTVLPFKSITAFADQQYRDLKLRPASSSEKSTVRTQILAGKEPVTVVQQLIDGPDWAGKQSPVIRLFQAYFKRLPDVGGLNYWSNKSRNGTRIGVISSNFAASNEFKTKYGKATNREFVELVYDNVLGRPGDPGGIASWTSKLDRKVKNRGEVMIGFSESNEYKNKTASQVSIVNFYTGLFRIVPPKSTIDGAGGMIVTGTAMNPYIQTAMTFSEYTSRIKP